MVVALLTLLAAGFGLYHDLGLPLAAGIVVMLLGRWRILIEAVHYQPQRIPYVYGPMT